MTREEAIERLKEIDIRDALQEDYDALHMAVKALEQEPKTDGDCISRQAVLDAFADYVGSGMSMDDFDALWNIVAKMPSVQPESE